MKKRFFSIDFLRAIGILGVIATHVFSDNLTNPLNTFIWNYLHFVITSFIFCSGFVMYVLYKEKVTTIASSLVWLKKRFTRLLIPYYLYFAIHLSFVIFLPFFFSGLGIQKNAAYIIESVTFTGGLNENWLPLLFLQLAFLFPLLLFLLQKHKKLFYGYIILCCLFTLYLTVYTFPYAFYRYVQWIPWSLIFVLSWFFAAKNIGKQVYAWIGVGTSIVFAFLFFLFSVFHKSLVLIDNKYPPNFFYIAYECAVSFFILSLTSFKLLEKKWIVIGAEFFSSHSYGLFFIHFLFLDFILQINVHFHLGFSVWIELLLVTFLSVLCIYMWDRRKLFMKMS